MDVDGTLTDGKIYMGNDGEVMKAFDIKDGYGIHDLLLPFGILPVIITGRGSGMLLSRCEELGIKKVFQNVHNKLEELIRIVESDGNNLSSVAYIGDDMNDAACMKAVKEAGGFTGCPKDAVKGIQKIAIFRSNNNGGNGAVRDFIEWILSKNKYEL
ncbi:3-deoxy-D-manno-octulosonate 8-phosphate phosphatase (KDO 8-P phosphatase) [Xylanibacter ruminicola]|uniref:3-deoxy-D-manno-octulosonate 8-phosphate phosphatase (KDO 8-P phosphatase) n=2 Tax=Xylanibacter ruminicola TaxID=839 RepID=A0A1M7JI10_XYLRU|nr:3-deoxy-D-manno-octulosonate 8-phosphate phosphatase (KDO 8-P phosphatase) [Xylanibacter ruminicola]SHM52729.1 3-deoxy-D-manno-octulosonate 8-phosphate phosphatase (KDO 8-P phosphatase) [Xylanibacter ruminicola]